MRQNLKTHTGNRIVLELDGKEVGLVQSYTADDDYGLEDASGIGDIHVVEHVPTKAVHSISVSNMTMFRKNLRDLGIAPENGDQMLKGFVFDLVVYSKDTGQVLRKYTDLSYASGRTEVGAHRIVMQSAQFRAIDAAGTGI